MSKVRATSFRKYSAEYYAHRAVPKGSEEKPSRFFVLFNANVTPREMMEMSPEMRKLFIEAHRNFVAALRRSGTTLVRDANASRGIPSRSPLRIKSVDPATIEIGKVQQGVHLHAEISLNAFGHLDLKKIRDLFTKFVQSFTNHGVKFDWRVIQDHSTNISYYLRKDAERIEL